MCRLTTSLLLLSNMAKFSLSQTKINKINGLQQVVHGSEVQMMRVYLGVQPQVLLERCFNLNIFSGVRNVFGINVDNKKVDPYKNITIKYSINQTNIKYFLDYKNSNDIKSLMVKSSIPNLIKNFF